MHYIGHFHFRRTGLTAQSLSIELDRSTNNRIRVTFKISVAEFNDGGVAEVVGLGLA